MSDPLKLLILGRDPDMFAGSRGAANDTRDRHIAYVRELQRRRPGSEVRIVVHTFAPDGGRYDEPIPGLRLYGTFSRSRWRCPIDMSRLLRAFRDEGWSADVVSCQTGYEEGLIALALTGPSSRLEIQMHSDFYGRAFVGRSPMRALQQQVLRATVRRSDHVRAVSAGIKAAMVRSQDISADRITVAPVPVSFVPVVRASTVSPPTVLFVGRLSPEKDLGLWSAVAHIIQQRVPAARFIVAGDGPERARIATWGEPLGGSLHLLGAVPYAELPPLYAGAAVFLLTSHYEGFGRVVIESMLAGVPVVSTDTLGPRELIRDGETGRIVSSREPSELAAAVIELLEDPQRAGELSSAAQSWAESHYGFEAVTRRLVDSWERTAAMPKRSS